MPRFWPVSLQSFQLHGQTIMFPRRPRRINACIAALAFRVRIRSPSPSCLPAFLIRFFVHARFLSATSRLSPVADSFNPPFCPPFSIKAFWLLYPGPARCECATNKECREREVRVGTGNVGGICADSFVQTGNLVKVTTHFLTL